MHTTQSKIQDTRHCCFQPLNGQQNFIHIMTHKCTKCKELISCIWSPYQNTPNHDSLLFQYANLFQIMSMIMYNAHCKMLKAFPIVMLPKQLALSRHKDNGYHMVSLYWSIWRIYFAIWFGACQFEKRVIFDIPYSSSFLWFKFLINNMDIKNKSNVS